MARESHIRLPASRKVVSSLAIIILAALLLQLASIVQYQYTRSMLIRELEDRMGSELSFKTGCIRNTLWEAEWTMQEHLGEMQEHLSHPDSLFEVTRSLIQVNPYAVGGCMAFVPDYYPSKGRLFEPYAYKEDGVIRVTDIGNDGHDYTTHPAFRSVVERLEDEWSDPYLYGGNTRLTTYSYPLMDRNGTLAAVCGLDLDLTWLRDTLNANMLYPSSFGLLLTKTGDLVIGPPSDYARQEVVDRIVDLVRNASDGDVHTLGRKDRIIGFRDAGKRGKAFVYFSTLPEDPGWTVALVSYADEVFAPANRLRLINFLMFLAGLTIFFFIIFLFARNANRLQRAEVDRARIGTELRVARNIQESMLPKHFPAFPDRNDIDVFGSVIPAKEVGGDLFDFFIRDGKLFFCIGDVSGKGVPAAMLMAVIHSVFRVVSASEDDPSRIMGILNRESSRNNESNMFATFFIGVLDLASGGLRFCNAGHDRPFLLGKTVEELPVEANLPIGAFSDFEYGTQECLIPAGSTLFLYTDGLTEARNPQRELYSSARLSETLRAAGPVKDSRSLVDKMEGEVDRFVDGAVQSDDLTMLAIRYSGPGVFPGEKLSLENDVRQVTRLSEFLKGVSGRLNLSAKTANDIRLAVEETVVNAMNYAYPDGRKGEILVEAETDGKALTFTISDAGAPFDPTAVPDADTTLPAEDRPIGGLGLFLVRNLVDTMHYDRVNDRNILTLVKIINDHTDENDHSRN